MTSSALAPLLASATTTKNTRGPGAVATFFGAGYGKPGPGTWGSVAAVLLWAAVAWGLHPPRPARCFSSLRQASSLAIVLASPRPPSSRANPAAHDPGFVVIDEVAGQWIALLGSPRRLAPRADRADPLSPLRHHQAFPARQLESLPEGWGIVFDDVAAGLYALGVASLLRIWI